MNGIQGKIETTLDGLNRCLSQVAEKVKATFSPMIGLPDDCGVPQDNQCIEECGGYQQGLTAFVKQQIASGAFINGLVEKLKTWPVYEDGGVDEELDTFIDNCINKWAPDNLPDRHFERLIRGALYDAEYRGSFNVMRSTIFMWAAAHGQHGILTSLIEAYRRNFGELALIGLLARPVIGTYRRSDPPVKVSILSFAINNKHAGCVSVLLTSGAILTQIGEELNLKGKNGLLYAGHFGQLSVNAVIGAWLRDSLSTYLNQDEQIFWAKCMDSAKMDEDFFGEGPIYLMSEIGRNPQFMSYLKKAETAYLNSLRDQYEARFT